MVNDRRRHSKVCVSANHTIEGMESAVVTVTGYKGTERFELIKIIDKSGANHVGTMSESITHLVCWKYEGRKYELARKFKIQIVNHQWVEDCIREGRRVPESPYTTKCGQQVGPLVLNVSSISELLLRQQSNLQRDPKQSEGDLRREESTHTVTTDSESLIKECELKLTKHRLLREKRKKSSQVHNSVGSRCLLDEPLFMGSLRAKGSCSSDSGSLLGQTKIESASAVPSQKGRKRRLVKKNITSEPLEISSDSDEANVPFSVHEENTSGDYASHLDDNRHRDLHNSVSHEFGEEFIEDIIDVDKTRDTNDVLGDEDTNPPGNATSSSQSTDAIQKENNTGDATILPAPSEPSCVICLTTSSNTRGVLPCGHRFCFHCIQDWAERSVSSGKTSTCPLCKASFTSITKKGDALPSDQKIYSQTIPIADSRDDIYILPERCPQNLYSGPSAAPICCRCSCVEPEDLLVPCNMCEIRYIHSFCQDPPVSPWLCSSCKDLQRLYLRIR